MIQYKAMVDWWKENGVPTYMAVSAYLNISKPKGNTPTAPGSDFGNLEDLEAMFSSTGGLIQ